MNLFTSPATASDAKSLFWMATAWQLSMTLLRRKRLLCGPRGTTSSMAWRITIELDVGNAQSRPAPRPVHAREAQEVPHELGLADVLPGRSWAELQPHFERLFTALLRVLDDVKETVRKAALAGWR